MHFFFFFPKRQAHFFPCSPAILFSPEEAVPVRIFKYGYVSGRGENRRTCHIERSHIPDKGLSLSKECLRGSELFVFNALVIINDQLEV